MGGYCAPCDKPNTVGRTTDGGKTWENGKQALGRKQWTIARYGRRKPRVDDHIRQRETSHSVQDDRRRHALETEWCVEAIGINVKLPPLVDSSTDGQLVNFVASACTV